MIKLLTSNIIPEKRDKKLIITALSEKCDNVTHIIHNLVPIF